MKYIYLAKQYNLVVGDKFELFYRGVIRLHNPYQYYILVSCPKGNPYPRYFTYTPKENEVGSYSLKIQLIDNDNNVIDEGETTLIVEKGKVIDSLGGYKEKDETIEFFKNNGIIG